MENYIEKEESLKHASVGAELLCEAVQFGIVNPTNQPKYLDNATDIIGFGLCANVRQTEMTETSAEIPHASLGFHEMILQTPESTKQPKGSTKPANIDENAETSSLTLAPHMSSVYTSHSEVEQATQRSKDPVDNEIENCPLNANKPMCELTDIVKNGHRIKSIDHLVYVLESAMESVIERESVDFQDSKGKFMFRDEAYAHRVYIEYVLPETNKEHWDIVNRNQIEQTKFRGSGSLVNANCIGILNQSIKYLHPTGSENECPIGSENEYTTELDSLRKYPSNIESNRSISLHEFDGNGDIPSIVCRKPATCQEEEIRRKEAPHSISDELEDIVRTSYAAEFGEESVVALIVEIVQNATNEDRLEDCIQNLEEMYEEVSIMRPLSIFNEFVLDSMQFMNTGIHNRVSCFSPVYAGFVGYKRNPLSDCNLRFMYMNENFYTAYASIHRNLSIMEEIACSSPPIFVLSTKRAKSLELPRTLNISHYSEFSQERISMNKTNSQSTLEGLNALNGEPIPKENTYIMKAEHSSKWSESSICINSDQQPEISEDQQTYAGLFIETKPPLVSILQDEDLFKSSSQLSDVSNEPILPLFFNLMDPLQGTEIVERERKNSGDSDISVEGSIDKELQTDVRPMSHLKTETGSEYVDSHPFTGTECVEDIEESENPLSSEYITEPMRLYDKDALYITSFMVDDYFTPPNVQEKNTSRDSSFSVISSSELE